MNHRRRSLVRKHSGVLCVLVFFAWLASGYPSIALGGAALVVAFGIAAYRKTAASAYLLGAYLIPLFAFGRAYSYLGLDPVYVPEVLLLSGLALSAPLWWETYLTAVPGWYRWSTVAFAAIGLLSTWNGLAHGYPDALKGLVFVVYPLASGPFAAWIRVNGPSWRSIALGAAVAAPIGLLILSVADPPEMIAAAYGFYLAGLVVVAATTPPGRGRWAVIAAACAGPILLLGTGERGPALTLIVAMLVARIVWRRRTGRTIRPLVIAASLGVGALVFAVLVVGMAPSRLPVVGREVRRSSQTFGAPGPESEANVAFRFDLWRYSLDTAVHHGFWVGTGFGRPFDFRFRSVDFRTVDTGGPHNSFIGVFYYMGFPAGLLFITTIIMAFRSAAQSRNSARLAAILVGMLAAAVSTMVTNVALEGPFIGGPIWILIAWSVLAPSAETPEPTHAQHVARHA